MVGILIDLIHLKKLRISNMIKIQDLTEGHIGKWVEYTAPHGETERGRIKSWNDKYVFVVYKCAGEWKRFFDYTGQATDPNDLEFIHVEDDDEYEV